MPSGPIPRRSAPEVPLSHPSKSPAAEPAAPAGPLHLVKLCVGAAGIGDLRDWQAAHFPGRDPRHVTRMWPRREAEVLAGGSLYWVFRGLILARQGIVSLTEVQGADGIRRCAVGLDARIVPTEPVPRRPFQGWRYLPAAEAPRDLDPGRRREDLPPALAAALDEIGLR